MSSTDWAVYVLKDETGAIRYVGVSKNPKRRLGYHMREWRATAAGKTHRHAWMASMLARGVKPTLEVVEWTPDWDEAERRWIAKCRADGCNLVNGNDGGRTMRQAQARSESYPAVKRMYRYFEGNLRCLKRLGTPEQAAKAERHLENYRLMVAYMREQGPETMRRFDGGLARRWPND